MRLWCYGLVGSQVKMFVFHKLQIFSKTFILLLTIIIATNVIGALISLALPCGAYILDLHNWISCGEVTFCIKSDKL